MNAPTNPGRLVVLAGPSCVGKSPLAAALGRLHPALAARLHPVVLYNSRDPRPGEADGVDYHFRTAEEIEALGHSDPERYVVLEVRGDTQGLDLVELRERLAGGEDAFFEGNPFVGRRLVEEAAAGGIDCLGLFVAPLSGEELRSLAAAEGCDPEAAVTEIMRRKLLVRTRRQRGELGDEDLAEVERRCRSAWRELAFAASFPWVIPNHDGEDSQNWDVLGQVIGDARRSLMAVVAALQGEAAPGFVESGEAFAAAVGVGVRG